MIETDEDEVRGVNTGAAADAEAVMQARLREAAMRGRHADRAGDRVTSPTTRSSAAT